MTLNKASLNLSNFANLIRVSLHPTGFSYINTTFTIREAVLGAISEMNLRLSGSV